LHSRMMTPEEAALQALKGPGIDLSRVKFPSQPGLYALHARAEAWDKLKLENADGRALYVGKAEESLQGRDPKTRSTTGTTGWSTLRRTLGARLDFRPIPRSGAGTPKSNQYSLHEEDDRALTEWMRSQLRVAIWVKPRDCANLGDVERAVIAA